MVQGPTNFLPRCLSLFGVKLKGRNPAAIFFSWCQFQSYQMPISNTEGGLRKTLFQSFKLFKTTSYLQCRVSREIFISLNFASLQCACVLSDISTTCKLNCTISCPVKLRTKVCLLVYCPHMKSILQMIIFWFSAMLRALSLYTYVPQ